jgi:hypothetical protein
MTPRAVKRFVNRVRYFAMMEGSFRPVARWWQRLADFLEPKSQGLVEVRRESTREQLLVALATIYEKNPEWFAGDLDSFGREVKAAQDRGLLMDLDELESETFWRFKNLIAGVELR